MPTYRLTVAYDGTGFAGWQIQPGKRTVQGLLTEACTRLAGGEPVKVTGAGRTDAGVHALGQVAGVTLAQEWRTNELERALNGNMPADLAVLGVEEAQPGFDARRHAHWREYAYRIRAARNPLRERYSWWLPRKLDRDAMGEVAAVLEGVHDFTSFSAAPDGEVGVRGMVRNLLALSVVEEGDELVIRARADGFLTHMVRLLVWALKLAGEGRLSARDAHDVLMAERRGLIRQRAPARGLCLMRVGY